MNTTETRCAECGNVFLQRKPKQAYCSVPCARKKNGGHNRKPETWWTNAKGYIEGRVWINGSQVRVKQHRWIMEKSIGRPLRSTEDIHHLDGNKSNNLLSNLEIIEHGQHSIVSNTSRVYKRGYKLKLSDSERESRSFRLAQRHAKNRLAKAQGRQP
jgi:hypothetical protein